MEKGFCQPTAAVVTSRVTIPESVQSDWREALPVLSSGAFTIRELELSDAPSLLAMLTTEEVTRFISPPPTTVQGFERFITWTKQQRAAGQYIGFAVVPASMTTAIGLFQVRSLSPEAFQKVTEIVQTFKPLFASTRVQPEDVYAE